MTPDVEQYLADYHAATESGRNHQTAHADSLKRRGRAILRMRETGMTYQAIADLVGLTHQRVQKLSAKASL